MNMDLWRTCPEDTLLNICVTSYYHERRDEFHGAFSCKAAHAKVILIIVWCIFGGLWIALAIAYAVYTRKKEPDDTPET